MIRLAKPFGCLVLFLLLAGCATTIRMEIMRPAEVNMAGARRVAVMDFGIPPENNRAWTWDELWALALAKMLNLETARKATLVEKLAQYTTGTMIGTLASTRYFEVVNPGDITTLVNETEQFTRIEKTKDKTTGKDTETTVLYAKRTLALELTYRAVNTTTGAIMATKTLEGSNASEIRYVDRGSLESEEAVFRGMIDAMLPNIAKQIAPYTETVYRVLMKDETKDPAMKEADELVKNNLCDSALATVRQVVAATASRKAMGEYNRLLKEKKDQEELLRQL